MTSMNRFCRYCGKEHPDGTVQYCTYCGAAKDHQVTTTEAQNFADGKETQSPIIPALLNRGVTRLSPTGRQGRLAFFLNILAIWVVLFGINYIIAYVYFGMYPYALDDSLDGVAFGGAILTFLLTAFQMVKRLHDFGRPGWHLFFCAIPFWYLYEWFKLICVSGDKAPNDYGP